MGGFSTSASEDAASGDYDAAAAGDDDGFVVSRISSCFPKRLFAPVSLSNLGWLSNQRVRQMSLLFHFLYRRVIGFDLVLAAEAGDWPPNI